MSVAFEMYCMIAHPPTAKLNSIDKSNLTAAAMAAGAAWCVVSTNEFKSDALEQYVVV